MRRNKIIGAVGMLVSLGFFAAGTLALASEPPVLSDASLQAGVQASFEKAELLHAGGPWVEVKDGVVVLTGKVKHVWARDRAIELAMEQAGVVAVEDHLEIAQAENDKKLGEELAKQVRRYVYFTIWDDVKLAVDEGNVHLVGRVTQPYKRKELEQRLQKVMGVQSLTNELRVLSVSLHDQSLRRALTYRIYRDSLFRDQAFRVNPPVHIIVEGGRVTLTGAVRSKVERAKAGHIARQTPGVFAVENDLVVGS